MVETIFTISSLGYGAQNFNPRCECWDLLINYEALDKAFIAQDNLPQDCPIKIMTWSSREVMSHQFYLMDYAKGIIKNPKIKNKAVIPTMKSLKKSLEEQDWESVADLFGLSLVKLQKELNNSNHSFSRE